MENLEKTPVRKKRKGYTEVAAAQNDRISMRIGDLHLTQKAFTTSQETMIRGYKVETCLASGGCPRRTGETETLAARLDFCLAQRDILSFLTKRIRGSLRTHHEFRVAIAGCPNGCTQPQIRDMGILALCRPRVADMDCSRCGHCIHACPDKALSLNTDGIHILKALYARRYLHHNLQGWRASDC
ncbi:hypothetical protein OOT00_08445 [Desulfobotulus sp. H1]|uniref:4Fe-4S ferredoxin-type domain-containing protein n=1 Tax=Desulfobotulus pelophilus TaxID=2823377 RepID=A0ABT3N973_9BACT|nr:hypothetical protein [Desulfobotulus pelophilus]MCW7754014.1 hypothetical protein [Desulfobotulus pelophilus]